MSAARRLAVEVHACRPSADGRWRARLAAALRCGSGGAAGEHAPVEQRRRRQPRRPSCARRRGDYRWLVRTAGAPPSIADENRAPGTTAWRLPGPATLLGGGARGRDRGLRRRAGGGAGADRARVRERPARANGHGAGLSDGLVRGHGRQAGPAKQALAASRASLRAPIALTTGLTECRWHATLSFPIPQALASGVYIVKLHASDGAQSDCLFVVRPERPPRCSSRSRRPPTRRTTRGEATACIRADSAWGRRGTTQGVEVSYDRPYDSQTGAGQFFIREVAMVRFLERYGYPASYTTIDSIDREPGQVDRARALMDVGHSEYWSQDAASAFASARDAGTSLIFISSDTMAWRVRFAPASPGLEPGRRARPHDRRLQGARGDRSRRKHRAVSFRSGERTLVGSAYNGCITPRVARPGPPAYRYYSWTPAGRLAAGVAVRRYGRESVDADPRDRRLRARPAHARRAAGHAARGRRRGRAVHARDRALAGARHGREAPSIRRAPGAFVFATGTLGWEYALSPVPQASPDAPRRPTARVVAMTRNLLARALGRR